MTEPKVVHEWLDEDGWFHAVDDDNGYHQKDGKEAGQSYSLVDDIQEEVTTELARLAARVKELEEKVASQRRAFGGSLEVLDAENARLRKALGEYGHHKPRCKLDPCDCGILEALKEKP